MSSFAFVSHESFPEDKYIKEIVYMLVNGLRVAYVHKQMQNGGSFWDVMASSVEKDGKRDSHKAVKFGDAFLAEDIKDFLKRRKWEERCAPMSRVEVQHSFPEQSHSMGEVAENEQLPF